jgi:ATP/ADP translocase
MRDAFREYFGWKHATQASMWIGLIWLGACMKVLEFTRPVHPIIMLVIVVPIVVWMCVTAHLHERYRNPHDE